MIDLRSDTVTAPTPAMRRAMAVADVGDDGYHDDPTVNALEDAAAALLGKEAGLFVPSGTMGNLVAQLTYLNAGQRVVAGRASHIARNHPTGIASPDNHPGVPVGTGVVLIEEQPDGTLDPAVIDAVIRESSGATDSIGLTTVENANARSGGQPLTPAYVREISAISRAHAVPLHVDGARILNAATALNVSPTELAGPADSVMYCLSKGLGCPVGSMLVGTRGFIERARTVRRLLGGGMRQAGVLAATGLVALRDGPDGMIERLSKDHSNARRLAAGLAETDGIVSPGGIAQPEPGRLDPDRVRTNFVIFDVERDVFAFLDALKRRSVLMGEFGPIRAVTHHGVTAADIETVLAAVRAALAETATTVAPSHQRATP